MKRKLIYILSLVVMLGMTSVISKADRLERVRAYVDNEGIVISGSSGIYIINPSRHGQDKLVEIKCYLWVKPLTWTIKRGDIFLVASYGDLPPRGVIMPRLYKIPRNKLSILQSIFSPIEISISYDNGRMIFNSSGLNQADANKYRIAVMPAIGGFVYHTANPKKTKNWLGMIYKDKKLTSYIYSANKNRIYRISWQNHKWDISQIHVKLPEPLSVVNIDQGGLLVSYANHKFRRIKNNKLIKIEKDPILWLKLSEKGVTAQTNKIKKYLSARHGSGVVIFTSDTSHKTIQIQFHEFGDIDGQSVLKTMQAISDSLPKIMADKKADQKNSTK